MESIESSSEGEVWGQQGPTEERTSEPTTEITGPSDPPPSQTLIDLVGSSALPTKNVS